jgi:hypothetical protein
VGVSGGGVGAPPVGIAPSGDAVGVKLLARAAAPTSPRKFGRFSDSLGKDIFLNASSAMVSSAFILSSWAFKLLILACCSCRRMSRHPDVGAWVGMPSPG